MIVVGSVVAAVGEALIAAKERLNEADSVAGDGDLGLTVERAGQALLDLVPEFESMDIPQALRQSGLEIARRAPSTFGTLVSFGLLAAARSVPPSGTETPTGTLARLVRAAALGIQVKSKAQLGDKTFLDALFPIADALDEADARGWDAVSALQEAARAATTAAQGTREMQAKAGRAGWLPERSSGHVDAGAQVVVIAFEAAASEAFGSLRA